jgi:branched-chain amino acid transport system ATP-binding protein
MLTCSNIETFYDSAHVLFGVSLEVAAGRVACLVGRNGAGKTTCLRSIMGLTRPRSGSIRLDGEEISGLRAFEIARRGIGYVPEDRRIFADLTVQENLEVAQRRGRNTDRWTLERAYSTFPPLAEFRTRLGGRLSGGQQQMLTIARTLMGNPRLLLVDEPTEGLSPVIVQGLERMILDLKRAGLTLLVAAQDIRFAFRTADHLYVMDRGRIVYGDTIEAARRDQDSIHARLAV